MSRIWLVGPMGAGKTAVGQRVATLLGVEFTDTDRMVEELAGKSVARVWEEDGEEGFRTLERHVMAGLGDAPGVIATGGGAVLDPANRRIINGTVVWLDAAPDALADRLEEASERPLLKEADTVARLAELAAERAAAYQAVATHRIGTDDLDVEDVASLVARLWDT